MAESATPTVSPVMTAEGRYDSLASLRSPYLDRAREAAKISIPGLMPPEGASGATKFYKPFQSVLARGLNNLSAKIMLALFPPGSSFFKLTIDDFVVAALEKKAGSPEAAKDARAEFEKALGSVERAVINRMEQVGARLQILEAVKQLLVAGNALLQVLPGGKMVLHKLTNYVVKRDPEGTVVEIVLKQNLSRMTLPERARAIVESKTPEPKSDQPGDDSIALFTRITRKNQRGHSWWAVYQEIVGERIPGTEGTYPIDKSPWIPVRLFPSAGEDYSRGFIEEIIGDGQSLESLSQSIVEFSAAAAKILFMVNESGTTSKKRISEAPSGAFIDGNAEDITVLQLEKFADFRVTKETADGIEKRLEQAFLLSSSVQRNAERVTAEEIRLLAQDLEQAHAGLYSILSQEMQRALVAVYMLQMQKEGALPALPKEAVKPQIVTGLEALGRGADLQKLDILVNGGATLFGTEVVSEYIDPGSYFTRRGTALGIDTKGIVRTEEQVAQARQQKIAAETLSKVAPQALKGAQEAAASQQPNQ
jgi:hypothetical protein